MEEVGWGECVGSDGGGGGVVVVVICCGPSSPFEKYERNTDDICLKRRYRWNILQWSKKDFKSKNNTNGDYYPL